MTDTIDDGLLTEMFKAQTKGKTSLTRRMVITIAHFLDASPRGVVLRLEDLRIVKAGCWDWFKTNGGITKQHVYEVLSSLKHSASIRALKEPGE